MLQIDSSIVQQMQQLQVSPQASPYWQQIMVYILKNKL
jgi:hypothetical protein